MSAKNGLTRSFRLLGCLMAVALLASALFASAASAKKTEPTNPTVMVNLGDSVSYGYTAQKFAENFPSEPPSAFEGGYPNLVQAKLAKKEAKVNNKLELANLACPGETSKGLIGNGPIAEGLEAAVEVTHFTGGEAPCGWHNSSGLPRHVEYGSVSQLEAAVGIVKASVEKTGPEVNHITLQIGSNDELHKLGECSSPAYLSAHGFSSFLQCVEVEAKNTLFPTIINNIGLTINVLRSNGYEGPIGILGFYNPQALLLPSDPLQKSLNENVEKVIEEGKFGPKVGYGNPFKKTNPQGKKSQTPKERLVAERNAICLYTEECNPFDRKVEYEKATKTVVTEEEMAAIIAAQESKLEKEEGGQFLPGDIHPTKAGDELFAKLVAKALKKA
jgi:lysophospholipase L1-like esterase